MGCEIKEMHEIVSKFCELRGWGKFHNAKDLSIGVVTEASELLEIFRFKSSDEVEQMFLGAVERGLIEDEIADVFFFLLRFCEIYKIDLISCLRKKTIKNGEKYPLDK